MLDDIAFVESLTFQDLKEEYRRARDAAIQDVEKKFRDEKSTLVARKEKGIEEDKAHRMILNACIFPFAQNDSLTKYGYTFLRASPLSEIGIANLDFLLFNPDAGTARAILGEAKGSVLSYDDVARQTKERVRMAEEKKSYIKEKYLRNLDAETEYVLGVDWPDGNRMMKTFLHKGGQIKVWSTGPGSVSLKQRLMLVTPAAEDGAAGKTMLHADKNFSNKMNGIETSTDFKSIFPESHTFAKVAMLAFIREKADGTFTFEDFLQLIREELDYLEPNEIANIAGRILEVAEDIGFIELMPTENPMGPPTYRIISRAKKADTRTADIRRKWVEFSIQKDKEQDMEERIRQVQGVYLEKRKTRRGIDEYP